MGSLDDLLEDQIRAEAERKEAEVKARRDAEVRERAAQAEAQRQQAEQKRRQQEQAEARARAEREEAEANARREAEARERVARVEAEAKAQVEAERKAAEKRRLEAEERRRKEEAERVAKEQRKAVLRVVQIIAGIAIIILGFVVRESIPAEWDFWFTISRFLILVSFISAGVGIIRSRYVGTFVLFLVALVITGLTAALLRSDSESLWILLLFPVSIGIHIKAWMSA